MSHPARATSPALGIDASQASQVRRTGVGQMAMGLIQALKDLVPSTVAVRLYSHHPLSGPLAELPPNWSSAVLRWPSNRLWPQIRLALALRRQAPAVLLSPSHLLPWSGRPRMVAILHDIGFQRVDALYGTDQLAIGPNGLAARGADGVVRLFSGGRYRACEQDYHRWSLAQAMGRASRLVTCSEFSREEIRAAYPNNRLPIEVIPWTIAADRFVAPCPPEARAAARRRYGIEGRYVLFVGRLERKKNVRLLVEAYARLRQLDSVPRSLVLAGNPGAGYEDIRAQIARCRLGSQVIETGWFADDDLPALMQEADLFVFPSLYEGFGLPILEAQSAGTPLVCSDLPVMREVAGEGAAYFIADSADDLARAALRLLNSAAEREARVAAGRVNAARFTWHRTATAYWELLANELALAGRPPDHQAGRAPGAVGQPP